MEFQVDMAEGITLPTESASPAGEMAADAARNEYAKVLSDPTHPHYDGLKRGSTESNAYVDRLYQNAYSAPPDLVDGVPVSEADSLAAEDARELEQLRTDWGQDGDSYDAGVQEATELGQVLFTADPQLFQEAEKRLDGPMALRVLRLLRQRVTF